MLRKCFFVLLVWGCAISSVLAEKDIYPTIEAFEEYDLGKFRAIFHGKKSLWVGGDNGVLKVTGRSVYHFGKHNSPLKSRVNDIVSDLDGNIWMSTNNNGVVFYNVSINEFTHFHELQGLGAERCDFFTVVNREVFATCNNGLFSINVDTKRVNQHLNNQGVFEDYTTAFNTIASDEQGRIWFVGDTDSLYYYEPETLSLVQVDTGDTSFLGKAVLSFDTSERLWISAEDKVYLVERANDNYRFSMVEQDVKHRPFFSVAEDYEGSIWFGGDTLLTYDSINKKISYPYAMYPLLV